MIQRIKSSSASVCSIKGEKLGGAKGERGHKVERAVFPNNEKRLKRQIGLHKTKKRRYVVFPEEWRRKQSISNNRRKGYILMETSAKAKDIEYIR